MKAKQALIYISGILAVCIIGAAAVLGPSVISKYYDSSVLSGVMLEEKDAAVEGYRYNLNVDEKLYVLSNALKNRVAPQSDYSAAIRANDSLSEVRTQSYAFQPVYNETSFNDKTRAAALTALRDELSALSEKGILPAIDFDPDGGSYDAALYTAIDVLEPKMSAEVWNISFDGIIIREGLVECVMDAQSYKIYSIAVRADKSWEEYDADEIVKLWAEYAGLSAPEPYALESALSESATYYKKYTINGAGDDKTVVTVGYYDGIKEFFIRI